MTEAELQQDIIELAHVLGYKVAHFRPALCKRGGALVYRTPVSADGAGFFDLILAKPGRIIAVECKSAKGKRTPEQVAWAEAVEGACEYYCWKPDQWDSIVEILNTQNGHEDTQNGHYPRSEEVIHGASR